MPPVNAKNQPSVLGSAATDLGLGSSLDDDLLDEDQRRKRLKEGRQELPGLYGDSVLGNAAMSLFTGVGKR